MPNARGEITNHDVREMRRLRLAGISDGKVAKAVGCSRSTVQRHTPDLRGPKDPRRAPFLPPSLSAEANRYAGFVERAAQLGMPLLVPAPSSSPSPF